MNRCSRSWEQAAKACCAAPRPTEKIEVEGTWRGGRKGVFRESKTSGGKALGEKGEAPVGSFDGYAVLVVEIVKFLQTKPIARAHGGDD